LFQIVLPLAFAFSKKAKSDIACLGGFNDKNNKENIVE
jgi:hypothetical protein